MPNYPGSAMHRRAELVDHIEPLTDDQKSRARSHARQHAQDEDEYLEFCRVLNIIEEELDAAL